MGGRLKMIQKTFFEMAMARQYTPARRGLIELDLGRVNHCLITKEKVKDRGREGRLEINLQKKVSDD